MQFKNQNGFESFIKSREGLGFEDDELLEEELESVLARLREVEKEYLRDFVAEYLRQIGQAVSYVETSSDESSFSESSNKEAARTKSGEECNAGGIPDRGSVSVGSEVSLGSDMSEGELLSLRADMTVEEQQVLDGGLKRKGHSRLPEASSRMRRPTEGSEKAVPDGVRGEGPDKGDVAREPPLQEEGGGEVREQRGGQPDDPPSVVEPFFASPETAEARGMSPAVKESGAGTDSREDVFERANGPQEGEPETAARGATVLGGGPNDCGTNAPPPEETVRTAGNAAANTERGADVRTQSTPEAISPGEAARGEAVPDGGDANACRNAPLPVGTGRTAGNTATVSDEELGFRRPPGHAKETGGATCGTAVPEGGAKERQNAPPQEERSKVTGDVAATLGGGPRVHSQSTPQGRRASWVARGTTVSEGAPNELQTPPPQEESDKATGDAAATLGGGPRLQSQSTPQGGGAGGVARGAAVSEGGPNERQNAPLQEERGKSTGDAAADFRGGARVRSRSTPKGGGSGKVARGTAILEGGARPPVDPSTTAGHTAADSLAGGKANVCDRTNPQAKEPGGAASNPAAVAEGGASEGEADGANLRRGSRKRKQTNRAVDGAKRRGVDMTEAGRFVDSEDVFYAGDTIVLDEDRVVRGGEYDRLKRLEQLAIGRKKRGAAPRKQRKIARDELVKLRVSSAAHPDPDMFKTTTDNKVYARVDGEWEYLWNTSMAIRRQVALLNGLNVEGLSDLEICYALRQLGDRMFFWSHGIKI